MHRIQNFTFRLLFAFLLIAGIMSCGDSRIATGVMLWPPDEHPEAHGIVVPIMEANRNTNTFLVKIGNNDAILVEQFRVRRFETVEEAEAFALEFQDYAFLYAESQQRALPVRRTQSTESQSVYRFREGEILKILGSPSEEVVISGLRGRWYPVLTEAGVQGYSFDFSLIVFDEREGISEQARLRELPAQARTILENVWRPHAFSELIDDGTPSLERLDTRYGLFPEPDRNVIRIVGDDVSAEFTYDNVVASGASHIRFEGSSLEARIDGSSQITVFFRVDGRDYTRRFRLLRTDLETIIERETERRARALEMLHGDGAILSSSSYGTIEVDASGRFSWTENELLIPGIISPSFASTGSVQFRYYLGTALRNRYDGVVSFRFDGAPEGDLVSFLYEVEPDGIRLIHVPPHTIDDLQVLRSEGSPVVIFFRYSEGEQALSPVPDGV